MIMERARLVIEGNVQGVGYRALIKQVARRLNIKGIARNLKDGNVEAFCECSPEILEKFISIIDIKGDAKEPFSVNVEKINIYKKGEKDYFWPDEKIETFDIDYDIKLTFFEKESLERSEIGALLLLDTRNEVKGSRGDIKAMHQDLKGMHQDLKGMHQDLKGLREESKQGFNGLNQEFKSFREETKNEFITIKTDYGRISQDLGKAVDSINRIAKSIETLAKAIAKKK
jgi:acylphosphatase